MRCHFLCAVCVRFVRPLCNVVLQCFVRLLTLRQYSVCNAACASMYTSLYSVCTPSVLYTLDSCLVPCVSRKCAILCAPTMLCALPRCSWAPGTRWSRLYSCCSSLVGAHSCIAGSAPCRVCCLHPHCHSTNTSQPSLHCSQ